MKHKDVRTTLLIDGDIVVWRAACAAQEDIDWGGGIFSTTADLKQAISRADMEISDYMVTLCAHRAIIALSDTNTNWRKDVLPSYKETRSGKRKPTVFYKLREHLMQTHDARWFPGLEADDVMGLYSTGKTVEGKRIIVSIDKDMRTIPGFLYNPGKRDLGVVEISETDADLAHFQQTLVGDRVDGYFGCPGVGPVKAERILEGVVPTGMTQYEWRGRAWRRVVEAYEKVKLTEQDALVQARVARILRAGEYTIKTGRVALWNPVASD